MNDEGAMDTLEETFNLVANDIRLDILWALWDIYTDKAVPEPDPVPFSSLKERVGVGDPGQFHYHLDKLVPQFVTHHPEGYSLTYAGARIVTAGISGVYTDTDVTLDEQPAGECVDCGGSLGVQYEHGHAFVDCNDCDARRIFSAPPILVAAHDVEAEPDLLGTFTTVQLQQTIRGFCFLCNGPVEGRVADSSLESGSDARGSVRVTYECTECGAPFYTDATTAVLDHPAVVSHLHDAGIDYREIPSWGIRRTLASEERIRSRDPVRVEVTVAVTDDPLTLVLDETLTVLEDRSSPSRSASPGD